MNFNTEKRQAVSRTKKTSPVETELSVTASRQDAWNVICSGILRKNGEKIIYVRFERGSDYAEGSIPEAKITSHSGGFTDEELEQFESYLSENRFEIIEQARTINLFKSITEHEIT